jgi:hypothetical protein
MGLTGRLPLRTMPLEPIRSKAMRLSILLLTLGVAGATSLSAQSLADVARKESERRQAVKGSSGKTYTDKDLKPVPAPPPDAAASAATPADNADPAKPAAADEKADAGVTSTDAKIAVAEPKDEAYWSKRMAALREQLERDETYLAALQNRVDSLTTDFVNRDDPAQKGQISAERQKVLGELDRLRKAVEQDKRAIPELEEEARREGVPAGWLR